MATAPARTAGVTASGEARGLLARQVVKIYKAVLGRGPTRAVVEQCAGNRVVCHLGEVLTPSERTLVDLGHAELVTEARVVMHESMVPALAAAAEQATGLQVADVALHVDAPADSAVEVFTLCDRVAPATRGASLRPGNRPGFDRGRAADRDRRGDDHEPATAADREPRTRPT